MGTHRIVIALGLILAFGCSSEQKEMKKADWLIGTWQHCENHQSELYEKWEQIDENELAGSNYLIQEGDSVILEKIQLIESPDGVKFVPRMKGKDGMTVEYKAKEFSKNRIVVEHPYSDFPKTISYTKITADSIETEIAGTTNGKEQKVLYSMVRVE